MIRRNFWQSLKKFCTWVQSHLKFSKIYRIFWNFANFAIEQFFDTMIVASSDKEWL